MTEFEPSYRSTLDLSMAIEEKNRFKTKLKDIALSSSKLFSDNCKFENNLSAEKINLLKALMRNKDIIIQKADKGNTVVITDKDKYIEGVKRAISDSNKFAQLNITTEKYLNYIINKKFKQLFKDLLDNDKISMIKFVPKVLEQEYFMAILKSINRLLITCQNFDQFCLL